MSCAAVIVAAGRGARFQSDLPKQWLPLLNKPLLCWTLEAFERCDAIDEIVLVVAPDSVPEAKERLAPFQFAKLRTICAGGAERALSVSNGLNALTPKTTHVAIHDGARPLPSPKLIENVVSAATRSGAAIAALPAVDTIKQGDNGQIKATLPRQTIYLAQTPQIFEIDLIRRAYAAWNDRSGAAAMTDDAKLVEDLGVTITLVEGERSNIKVTVPEDFELAAWYLTKEGPDARRHRI